MYHALPGLYFWRGRSAFSRIWSRYAQRFGCDAVLRGLEAFAWNLSRIRGTQAEPDCFWTEKIFVKRPNGSELETTIVARLG